MKYKRLFDKMDCEKTSQDGIVELYWCFCFILIFFFFSCADNSTAIKLNDNSFRDEYIEYKKLEKIQLDRLTKEGILNLLDSTKWYLYCEFYKYPLPLKMNNTKNDIFLSELEITLNDYYIDSLNNYIDIYSSFVYPNSYTSYIVGSYDNHIYIGVRFDRITKKFLCFHHLHALAFKQVNLSILTDTFFLKHKINKIHPDLKKFLSL